MTSLTPMEKRLMMAMTTNEYTDGTEDSWGQWTWAVIDESGIDPKQARGALSSLIQKGMVTEQDYEGKGRPDDMTLAFTPEGKAEVRKLLQPA